MADPKYVGPIRIRAAGIDGSGQLLLGGPDNPWNSSRVKTVEGTDLYSELDFLESHTVSNPPSTWRVWPSDAYVSTSGCYGWQIEGLGFTELITIQALQVPTLAPGAPCPVSQQQIGHSLSAEFGSGPAVGTGPVYPLMGEMQEGVLKYSESSSQSRNKDGWAYSKVLWMAKPGVKGQVVIRGRQTDGPNAIGFGMSDSPESLLQWDVGSQAGWASLPSMTRIRAPGC